MSRANRLSSQGGIFHVTHRCHNREFLLKFARDRDGYRAKLREYLAGYEAALLDYCITSNHVHLLLGSAGFVERIRPLILSRRETELAQIDEGLWVCRNHAAPYGPKTTPKRAPSGLC